MASIQKEREKAAKKANKGLVAFNKSGGGGLDASYRGTVSGFDINIISVPGVVSFNPANEGQPVAKKYLSYEGTHFTPISEEEADNKIKNKKSGDYGLLIIEESNGQLGPTDYKCYCSLEQIIYREVMDNYGYYRDGATAAEDWQEVCIGSKNTFALAALKDKSDDAYRRVEQFFERINGLSFTTKAAVGFAYVMEKGKKPVAEDGFFKPFWGSKYEGKENGRQKLYLKVHNKIILNILFGGTKLQFNEILNAISNPKSKHLWRLLSLLDKKGTIFIKYSLLVGIFELERQETLSEARRQIGRIAKPINYDPENLVLPWPTDASKNEPFGDKPLDEKNDWQFLFNLNACVTPNMYCYLPHYFIDKEAKKHLKERRLLLSSIREDAYEAGMSPDVYVFENKELLIGRLEIVSRYEYDGILREFQSKQDKRTAIGSMYEKFHGDLDKAVTAAKEMVEQKKLVDKEKLLEQAVVVPKKKRGRPKNKMPYTDPDSDIPF